MMEDSMSAQTRSISVAMATYNGARYLQQQLDSLASQTRLPSELVVTDDGSTDETLEILDRFGKSSPFPVRVFRNQSRFGYANNFLHAASLCTSTLIAFCDQDDVWLDKKIDTIVPFFEDPDVVLAAHSSAVWDGEQLTGEFYPRFESTTVHEPVSVDPFLICPGFSIVFRAEILGYIPHEDRPQHPLNLDSGDAPEPMAHDAWALFLAAALGRMVTVADTLAHYRQHGRNVKGAPQAAGSGNRLLWALGMTGYEKLAELEAHSASKFEELSGAVPPRLRKNVAATARNFRLRSRFHHLRSVIYGSESNIFQRAWSFLNLVFLGAYGTDTTRTLLGHRAGIKDLCFGVPAFGRLKRQG